LPPLPEKSPRPLKGPDSVSSFIDSLTVNDAAFEVVVSQGRILTVKEDLAPAGQTALIAVGDPSIVDLKVVSRRQLRVVGLRVGATDVSITAVDGRVYGLEVRVVVDLELLRGQLRCIFPDAQVKLCQVRDNIVVEGQARDVAQVQRIIETIQAYVQSVIRGQARSLGGTQQQRGALPLLPQRPMEPVDPNRPGETPTGVGADLPGPSNVQATAGLPQIINLIRVPTSQQVLLKVRVAELNRTALRQMGSDFLAIDKDNGTIIGTNLTNGAISAIGTIGSRKLSGTATGANTSTTTAFGIFERGGFEIFLSALRRNSLLRILAEPNLIAMNGHQASFLAGGQFPVPVPQIGGAGNLGSNVTVQFQNFGVQLAFVPTVLDNDIIRLTVDPEVSEVDFSLATTLVPGGSPVPGLSTRRAHTTVEMHQGQTLAIAGLLQLTITGNTARIPGLGDLPILGPFFSNTSHDRVEKELIVLITPYLVEPLNCPQVPPSPGDEVLSPNDLEFYLLNRIEGRTGRDFRSTTEYDDATHVLRCLLKLENDYVRGPHGFCDYGR
jgi:pilus assembly protein CpaC